MQCGQRFASVKDTINHVHMSGQMRDRKELAMMERATAQDIDAGNAYSIDDEVCHVASVSFVEPYEYVHVTFIDGGVISLPYDYPVFYMGHSDMKCSRCQNVKPFAEL